MNKNLRPVKKPTEDTPAPIKKPALPVIKKAPINPTSQASDMAAKAEIEQARQNLRPGQIQKAPVTPAVIKHVWTKTDTYADLAFKYYGSNKEPYWRLIYDYNKQIIGNHPNDIRVGLEIVIPPLPDALKKK
jgi:nucleoid-associated protein YgaU